MRMAEKMKGTPETTGGMRVARRHVPATPVRLRSAAACRPVQQALESRGTEPAPIWMAVLHATKCHAVASGHGHAVSWDYTDGRAMYTNESGQAEEIQPLGVHLQVGHTLSVTWMPGETAYTLEIYRQSSQHAA